MQTNTCDGYWLEINGGYQCSKCNQYHCPRCGAIIPILSDGSALYCYDCNGYYDYIPRQSTTISVVSVGYWETSAIIAPIAPNVYSFDTFGHSLIIQSDNELAAAIERTCANKIIHLSGYPTFAKDNNDAS